MNDLVEFAEKMLITHREFHPFGGYLNEQEDVVHVGLSPEANWTDDQHRADALARSFRSLVQEKRPLAVGIVTNVWFARDTGATNAIRVFLEHRSGYCADVFFHYTLTDDRRVSITDTTAQQGLAHLFLDDTVSF
ncbi:MAG: hypothetical protein LKM32_07175 [Chiayiivirga sp.]|uniref:hypothetical protein n=1 Tax=Chiayiivirga sp. TaxID=2041042 RepID=UPI0025BD39F4|nr:hypothetical protein [Chiayiivirga sp.]MCI1729156.1 hypothetical protein [Chiayiivirga sp.]